MEHGMELKSASEPALPASFIKVKITNILAGHAILRNSQIHHALKSRLIKRTRLKFVASQS